MSVQKSLNGLQQKDESEAPLPGKTDVAATNKALLNLESRLYGASDGKRKEIHYSKIPEDFNREVFE